MNTFLAKREVEAASLKILLSYFEEIRGQLFYPTILMPGDDLASKPDGLLDLSPVEFKAEEKWTGNLFLESWSNRPIKKGWMYTNPADYLFYHFLDKDICYGFLFSKLKEYYLDNVYRYRHVPQGKTEQRNNTWGLLVPIEDLKNFPWYTEFQPLKELHNAKDSSGGDNSGW